MTDTITVTGNVATTPEFKVTAGGLAIATFRLASAQRRFDRGAGTWVDEGTNWYTVSAFRALAEHAATALAKGEPVIVTGRLRVRDWDNGTKRGTSIEIDADALGHDLRWGTTTFTKHASAAASGSASTAEESRTAEDSEAWAAPGTDVEPPLALAGTGSTPF